MRWFIFLIGLLGVFSTSSCAACEGNMARGLGKGFHLGEAFGRKVYEYKAISAAGATLVRFGLKLSSCKECDSYEIEPQAIEELLRNLDFAKSVGIRVVIVLRPPPEPNSDLWVKPTLQNSLDSLWGALASKLRNRSEVAAFDLVNEPHPSGLTFAIKERKWEELASRLIKTIRAVDPSRTIVFEPSPGARPMAFKYVNKLPFSNIIYSVHFYEPFEFTHQRIGDPRFKDVVDYPGLIAGQVLLDSAYLATELAPVKNFAEKNGVEIYVGEFGAVRWAPHGARVRYLQDLTSLFSNYGWSWTYHAYREWHGWDAEMGEIAADHRRTVSEPTFELLRKSLRECEWAISHEY